jgi:hypothetical protein
MAIFNRLGCFVLNDGNEAVDFDETRFGPSTLCRNDPPGRSIDDTVYGFPSSPMTTSISSPVSLSVTYTWRRSTSRMPFVVATAT